MQTKFAAFADWIPDTASSIASECSGLTFSSWHALQYIAGSGLPRTTSLPLTMTSKYSAKFKRLSVDRVRLSLAEVAMAVAIPTLLS
jgi:hypothetical protein